MKGLSGTRVRVQQCMCDGGDTVYSVPYIAVTLVLHKLEKLGRTNTTCPAPLFDSLLENHLVNQLIESVLTVRAWLTPHNRTWENSQQYQQYSYDQCFRSG